MWAKMFASLSDVNVSRETLVTVEQGFRSNPIPMLLLVVAALVLLYIAFWASFRWLPTQLLFVFGPSLLMSASAQETDPDSGKFCFVVLGLAVLLYLVKWRITALLLQLLIPIGAATGGMPGAVFHLAWCLLMIPLVSSQWIAEEKKKEALLKEEREKAEAYGAKIETDSSPPSDVRQAIGYLTFLGALFFTWVLWAKLPKEIPGELAVVRLYVTAVAVSSVIVLVLYKIDKTKAQRKERRVEEATLHFWEIVGGWPGGLLARESFRHKYKKSSFLIQSRLIMLFHACLILFGVALVDESFRRAFGPAVTPFLNVSGKCGVAVPEQGLQER